MNPVHQALLSRAAAPFLFLLNAALIFPWFSMEYPANMYSIEGAYYGLARFIQANFADLSWFPYWYGGIPFPNTYPPVPHMITALVASLSGLSAASAYHWVTGIAYCFIPVAVYALCRVLVLERLPALVTALLVSLLSPSAILMGSVRGDVGGWQYARRMHVLVAFGEGPHLVSILLCLLALAALHLALQHRNTPWFAASAFLCAATALSNWLGAVALALGAMALLLARERIADAASWIRAAAIGVVAYALAAPWLPPSTIGAIRRNAPFVEGRFEVTATTVVGWLAAIAGLVILLWLLRFVGAPVVVRFAALWAAPMLAMIVFSRKLQTPLLPQAIRYHIEMELALLIAVVASLWFLLLEMLDRRRLAFGWLGICALLCVWQLPVTWTYARTILQPGDGDSTIEAQSARWFASNLPGQRVWAPGSISFWMSAFADVPQFAGAFDNGVQNPNTLGVNYQIYSSDGAGERDGEIALIWLQAYGVRAVQVSFPESSEAYHPFRNPAKFEGLLEPLWEHRGTKVYRVPHRHAGLAFVIPEADVPRQAPADGLDIQEAQRYVAALGDATLPQTEWRWLSHHEALITSETLAAQVLSVQCAYHPGWEAYGQEGVIPVERDALGQIVLRPRPGKQRIRLVFTGGAEAQLTRWMSWLGIALLLVLAGMELRDRRRRKSNPPAPLPVRG